MTHIVCLFLSIEKGIEANNTPAPTIPGWTGNNTWTSRPGGDVRSSLYTSLWGKNCIWPPFKFNHHNVGAI